jgi:tetratricopeptide (TPR) repeat protein
MSHGVHNMTESTDDSIKNILILTDRGFFKPTKEKMADCSSNHIDAIINIATESGVSVEVEESIDCKTGMFHRTSNAKFNFILYISNRSIESFWRGFDPFIGSKLTKGGEVIDYWKEWGGVDYRPVDNMKIINMLRKYEVINEIQMDKSNQVNKYLINTLKQSMEQSNNLRSEMLIQVLLGYKKVIIAELFKCLDFHQQPEKIIFRIIQRLPETITFPDVEKYFSEGKKYQVENISLMKAAVLASEMKNVNELICSAKTKKDASRILFLNSKTAFSGKVMLNLVIDGPRFGSISEAWLFNNHWKDDFEMMEYWTIISPRDEESWQIYSRALWNRGDKLECAEVANKGLSYHPESVNLLRRKAHGLRIKGEHYEAVKIEKMLLQSDKLSKLDTIIYLVRGLYVLKEWKQVLDFIEMGLVINPDLDEFHDKKQKSLEFLKE